MTYLSPGEMPLEEHSEHVVMVTTLSPTLRAAAPTSDAPL